MVYDMDPDESPGLEMTVKEEQETEETIDVTRSESGADPMEVVTGDVAKKMRRRFLNIFARCRPGGGACSPPLPPSLPYMANSMTPRVHMGQKEGEAKKKARAVAVALAKRSKSGSFFCSECGMAFKQEQYMKLHERACKAMQYTGKTERTTCDCPECPAVLKDKAALAEHLLLHRDDLFRCDVCGKGFEKLSKLTNHKVHHDRRLLRFQCADCGRAFPLLSSLRRHERKHPGLLVLCPHCPKKFRFDCLLRRHLQTHARPPHASAAGGVCRVCGLSVVSSLKLHMRTHAWRSPHRCRRCGVFFSDAAALRAHEEDGGRCDADKATLAGRRRKKPPVAAVTDAQRRQDSSNRRFSERLRKKEME